MCQTPITSNTLPGLIERYEVRQAANCKASKPHLETNGRRLKIWNVRHNCHCSIVGTCLSNSDLERLLKKCGLKTTSDVTPYGLHGYFTEQMSNDCALSRAVQKLLDKRFAGMVRTVGKTQDADALEALWQREYDAGRIAGVYWALQTHTHVPEDLLVKVFGEVHMLSHILGRTVHATAARASELQTRVEDLEEKLSRESQRHRDALDRRDARIQFLEQELLTNREQNAGLARTTNRQQSVPKATSKQERALMAARERTRRAEQALESLQRDIRTMETDLKELRRLQFTPANETDCPGAAACNLELPEGENLKVLYLGGRSGAVPRLKAIAETASAQLLHHDGGKEENFGRIDGMISRCHVVFCPVDCISHRACLYAKARCRHLDKTFVPLTSSGGSAFARALGQLQVA